MIGCTERKTNRQTYRTCEIRFKLCTIAQPLLPPCTSVSSYLSKFVLQPVSSRNREYSDIASASSLSRREYASVKLSRFDFAKFSAINVLRRPQWTLFWLHTVTAGKSIWGWKADVRFGQSTLTDDWLMVFVVVVVEFKLPIQLLRDQHVLTPIYFTISF